MDFRGRELVAAQLNGDDLDPAGWQSGRIPLTGLAPDNTLVIDGRMAYASDGEGLHRHVDPADQQTYLYAMSFLDAAPRWFACFDQPDLKARYELRVSAPEHWMVLGNGPSRHGGARSVGDHAQRPAVQLLRHPGGRAVRLGDRRARGHPAGFHARASLAPSSRPRPTRS